MIDADGIIRKLRHDKFERRQPGVKITRDIVSYYKSPIYQTQEAHINLPQQRSMSQEYRDAAVAEHHFDDLKNEVTRFVDYSIDCLVHKLLSSDEFNATLSRILTFSITSRVERGLRMGRTNFEFKEASQKVSNFLLGAEVEFNKVVVALPSISFHFLTKIANAAGGALSDVVNVQPDKIVRSTVNAHAPVTSLPTGETFG
ncbi:hypothetical protein Tco_0666049 [Tanacetum coccineum]